MLGRANSSPERQTNKKKKKHEKLSGVFSLEKRHVDTCSLFAKPPSLIPPAPPLSLVVSLLLHLWRRLGFTVGGD